MRLIGFVIAVLLVAPAVQAADEIYRWTDSDGDVHYTNDPTRVPPELRKAAKTTKGVELGQLPAHESDAAKAPAQEEVARAPVQEAVAPVVPAPDKPEKPDSVGPARRRQKRGRH